MLKIKLLIFITIILMVAVPLSICADNSSTNDFTSQTVIENQIHEIEKQLETINNTYKNIHRDFKETKTNLKNANERISSIEKQITLIQKDTINLKKEIDSTRSNFLEILATSMSSDWTQIGMFWSSLILVIITVMATYINYKIFRIQTDPDVVVYSIPDPSRPSFINLIIENIGRGVAKNIKFSSDKPIPSKAFGVDDNASVPQAMSSGPLIDGIPELGPGSKRVITWGQYHGLYKGLGDKILTITADYSAKKVFIKAPTFNSTFALDIISFKGTDGSDQNWNKKSTESLIKIAKSIEDIASSLQKQNTDD